MEEEDFEGFVKQFRSDFEYPYEVAYDDGDEEWGYFSATHFHTDEVRRRYTWLHDQDEAVAKAAAQVWQTLEATEPQPVKASAEATSNTTASRPAAAVPSGAIGSLALRKDQLRAMKDVLSDSKTVVSAAAASSSQHDSLPQPVSTQSAQPQTKAASQSVGQSRPNSLSSLVPSAAQRIGTAEPSTSDRSMPVAKSNAKLDASGDAQRPEASMIQPSASENGSAAGLAASKEAGASKAIDKPVEQQERSKASRLPGDGDQRGRVSAAAAAKLQLDSGQQKQLTPTKKRKAASLQDASNGLSVAQTSTSVDDAAAVANDKLQVDKDADLPSVHCMSVESTDPAESQAAEASKVSMALHEPQVLPGAAAHDSPQQQAPSEPAKSPLAVLEQQQHTDAPGKGQRPSPEKSAKQQAAAEKRIKHAHDQRSKGEPSSSKEPKRRRLRKASELSEGAAAKVATEAGALGSVHAQSDDDDDANDLQASTKH